MGAHTQRFGYTLPTVTTVLAGILRRNRNHLLSGARCLESKDGEECPHPASEMLLARVWFFTILATCKSS